MHEKLSFCAFYVFDSIKNDNKQFKNDENGRNSVNTHPNHSFLTGNSMSRPGEGPGSSPGSQKRPKNMKNEGFSPFGAGYPSVESRE